MLLRWTRTAYTTIGIAVAFALAWNVIAASPVAAQALAQGSVNGTVTTSDGTHVASANVTLIGPARLATTTDAQGAFNFPSVTPGTYTLSVLKAGFNALRQDGVSVNAGSAVSVTLQLTAVSFNGLREIGHVATNTPGQVQIDTTTAAINVITNQNFVDQGQQQVTKLLDETPGVVASRFTDGSGGSPLTPTIPQIRGAQPYETETLIDGHPVSVGANGYFAPIFLNTALLQSVEIAKGPGVLATEINYAIGGSVNYRTLEPTRTLQTSINFGTDQYGGSTTTARVTGSTGSHFLDYAFGYAIDGTPGPLQNYPIAGSQVPLIYGGASLNANGTGPWFVNGRGYAGIPEGLGASATPQYAGVPGEAYFAQPFYVCCSTLSSQYLNRAELAKLRFNFSQQTALTVSYLGGQNASNYLGSYANSLSILPPGYNFSSFAPPPGYTGSVPAGTAIPFDLVANNPQFQNTQQNLFQAEFRTTAQNTTFLARYYASGNSQYLYNYPSPTNLSFSGKAWGGAELCPTGVAFNFATGACQDGSAPTLTFFNGQNTKFTSGDAQQWQLTQDYNRGASAEVDQYAGNDIFTLSFDEQDHTSTFYTFLPTHEMIGYQLPPGSNQLFITSMLRGIIPIGPRFTATASEYLIQYFDHFTDNGGATWNDDDHAVSAPRLALLWRPDPDDSWRFAMGTSIAPPYLNLISAPAQVPTPNSVPATSFTLNLNNGNIKPETAFGYDLGFDKRFAQTYGVSTDLYLTNLYNMFLPSTFQNGTYSSPASGGVAVPLYVTQTQNLANARYEGWELALQNAPAQGLGWRLQGSLMKGYPYNLPAGFYSTAAGPYTTNLGVVSGVNFQPTGLGYNGFLSRTPYSNGYGELNYRTRWGMYGNVGVTYYGPNNSYNQPAFAVISANLRFPLAHGLTLQLSGDNIGDAYGNSWYGYLSGNPVPLVNGMHGATTGFLGSTDGGNVGPPVYRWILNYQFGARQ